MNLRLTVLTFFALTLSLQGFAQLPVVQAKGGQGTNVNWAEIKEKEDAVKDGPGFFYNGCAQGVSPEHASSTLESHGSKSYGLKNLADDNPMTAWVEGKLGYGIGEWFEVQAITVNVIYNGYQSSPKNWKNNSRVKRFKVYIDGKAVCLLDLTDEMGAQYFELPHRPNWENKANFRFEIVDVYKGDKWDDVCVSHVDHGACCFAPTTLIQLDAAKFQEINEVEEGAKVLCIDLESQKTFHATINKTTAQRHLSLLNVATASHSISITPDHPLHIKGKGFVSLAQLLSKMEADKSWTDLTGVEVMVYDEKSRTTHFEAIQSVEKVEGDFMTYTVLSINKGATYVANGFVNKTY